MEIIKDFINNNKVTFKKLAVCGLKPETALLYLDIYNHYESLSHIKSKMDRYTITAEDKNVSEWTIRQIVQLLESEV